MADLTLPLVVPLTATIGASGSVVASIGPTRPFETWKITRYVCSAPSACSLAIYRNYVSPLNIIDSTPNGVADIGGIQMQLNPGEKLFCSWSAGTSGAVVTIVLEGVAIHVGRGL